MTQNKAEDAVTATVLFDGLMLMCVTSDFVPSRCEVGFIRCHAGSHNPTVTIGIEHEGTPTMDPPIPITQDFHIRVVSPTSLGVDKRETGKDDDFSFVIDLEGYKLHREGVDLDTTKFYAKMFVTSGELYTKAFKLETPFKLVEWTEKDPTNTNPLGRYHPLQESVGLDITCRNEPGAGVEIVDLVKGGPIWLPRLDDADHYIIKINNECVAIRKPEANRVGSDFRMFYDEVVIPRSEIRYDIVSAVVGGVEPSPDVCELGFLSKRTSLGFFFDSRAQGASKKETVTGKKPAPKRNSGSASPAKKKKKK